MLIILYYIFSLHLYYCTNLLTCQRLSTDSNMVMDENATSYLICISLYKSSYLFKDINTFSFMMSCENITIYES